MGFTTESSLSRQNGPERPRNDTEHPQNIPQNVQGTFWSFTKTRQDHTGTHRRSTHIHQTRRPGLIRNSVESPAGPEHPRSEDQHPPKTCNLDSQCRPVATNHSLRRLVRHSNSGKTPGSVNGHPHPGGKFLLDPRTSLSRSPPSTLRRRLSQNFETNQLNHEFRPTGL